eukprot:gnl/Hemi2/18588_TR6146_c0_g1_i1.p1 gnl/Hemi2/18588_TR6146_c0_g1~~gnl/Hemi2/18588_TR6146_c0_g1_i1.p1  ORF type:complete len:100 (+),score=33.74 gnl/Hemi2/18588_TR6146_c0_g1_i1:69-368(+)
MGIFSLVFEGTLISAGVALMRRTTGVNVRSMVMPYVSNNTLKRGLDGYFSLGETVLDRSIRVAVSVHEREERLKTEALRQEAVKEKRAADEADRKLGQN